MVAGVAEFEVRGSLSSNRLTLIHSGSLSTTEAKILRAVTPSANFGMTRSREGTFISVEPPNHECDKIEW